MEIKGLRLKKLLLPVLLLLILSACEQSVQSEEPEETDGLFYSFENPETGQEFTIVHAYQNYENFFDTVEEKPDQTLFRSFKQEVIEPVHDACFVDNKRQQADTAALDWAPEESEFDSLRESIANINADHLNKAFEESLVKASDILPSDHQTTVCIFPYGEYAPSTMAEYGNGKIFVFHIRPDSYYKSGMAHEYHHSVWDQKHGGQKDFLTGLDHLILEGEAMMFETVVYPDHNSTFYHVDEKFNQEYWHQIQPVFESVSGGDIMHMIQGGNGLPVAYGYSEGYKIIRSYLDKNPGLSVEEWTSVGPEEIFEGSGYAANYE